jgi:hypothetical protein
MAHMNDAGITPIWKMMALPNPAKSKQEGRPIFDDCEMVEIRIAGSKDFTVQPAWAQSHWEVDEESGEQRIVTYAERFAKQYQQFKSKQHQTKSGTPLDYLPFLTEGKRSELRALSIYTAEALAEIDGQPLKNLGMGGRDLKNKATEWLASASHEAVLKRQQDQIEALQAQLRVIQEDREHKAGPNEPPRPPEPTPDDDEDDPPPDDDNTVRAGPGVHPDFVGMKRAQLRGFITERTGERPVGNPKLATLLRMAEAARK